MVIGICKIALDLHGNSSLKGKRKVVKSVKDRVKHRFNVSIAEVEDHDFHQRAVLGMAVVSADSAHADSQIQTVSSFIAEQALISDFQFELVHR